MQVKIFLFMGRPGAGKGVQSNLLSKALGLSIFSTGDMVRATAKEPTALGGRVAEVSNSGGLLPAWLASYFFETALLKLNDDEGIIFEGVGRKPEEAKLFNEILTWLGRDYCVFNLETSEEIVTGRLLKRAKTSGREDDHGHKLQTRFKNFEEETLQALNFFDSIGKVIHINGEPLPEVVHTQVMSEVKKING